MALERMPHIREELKRDMVLALSAYFSRVILPVKLNMENLAEFLLSDLERKDWHGVREITCPLSPPGSIFVAGRGDVRVEEKQYKPELDGDV